MHLLWVSGEDFVFRAELISQRASGLQCHTIKVVKGDNGIKVHAKDLAQLVHQRRVICGEDGNVVS